MFVVDLERWTCDCRKWDVTGIPCRHTWVAINHMRMDGESFISYNHTKAAYMKAYDMKINPIPQHTFWPNDLNDDECGPPAEKRLPSRPAVSRKKILLSHQ